MNECISSPNMVFHWSC